MARVRRACKWNISTFVLPARLQGAVVKRSISAQPGILFLSSKTFLRIFFSVIFKSIQ